MKSTDRPDAARAAREAQRLANEAKDLLTDAQSRPPERAQAQGIAGVGYALLALRLQVMADAAHLAEQIDTAVKVAGARRRVQRRWRRRGW